MDIKLLPWWQSMAQAQYTAHEYSSTAHQYNILVIHRMHSEIFVNIDYPCALNLKGITYLSLKVSGGCIIATNYGS